VSQSRTVFCAKHQVEDEGLAFAPWPGPLGQRVFREIGRRAWAEWLAHQTMLINEQRLSPMDPKHRAYLGEQMEKFLFGGGADAVQGYVPPAE
jgi:Fe-S cluster biosynthesis and repair protein YggX